MVLISQPGYVSTSTSRIGIIGTSNNSNSNHTSSGRKRLRIKANHVIAFSCIIFTMLLKLNLLAYYDMQAGVNIDGDGLVAPEPITIASSSSNNYAQPPTSKEYNNNDDDVFSFDEAALQNVHATHRGARSQVQWTAKTSLRKNYQTKSRVDDHDHPDDHDLRQLFQAAAISATVDRRPIIVRKQMKDDEEGVHKNGSLLGCATSSTTFVSNLTMIDFKEKHHIPTSCDVCFQFSNRQDMDNFVPNVRKQTNAIDTIDTATTTKCFGGTAELTARFAKWQLTDERFKDFGYPWTMDCRLPNGIEELTCREISKMEKDIDTVSGRDEVQRIYLRTKFTLDGWFDDSGDEKDWISKPFDVLSQWPWAALMSHDDDRSTIARNLPKSWNDGSSAYVPASAKELKLAHVEGPGYDATNYNGELSLKSVAMGRNVDSTGGLHARLVSNLFHLIRNAPGSTHIVAVVDGQMHRSHQALLTLLNTRISQLYPQYGPIVFDSLHELKKWNLVTLRKMDFVGKKKIQSSWGSTSNNSTLMDLLRIRGVKMKMIPITTTSQSFGKTVCGGQYAFAPYLAARYAADYQVMMFIDGDTAMIENSKRDKDQTLQGILYKRFFSKVSSSKCAGHRMRLIEQYVKPEDENNIDRLLQCTRDLSLSKEKWKYAMENCHLKEGHIVARTDSIYAFSVHHPDTLVGYAPEGVDDCITPRNTDTDRYFLKESEFVQIHLRNRQRKPECACFANSPP